MPSFAQRSFAGGEISPAIYGRADQAKYATGLKRCKNFLVQRFGGVQNRAGTEFIAEVKDSANPVRLLPFIFNDEQTYVLEFGKLTTTAYGSLATGYIRIFRNGSPVQPVASAWSSVTAYGVGDQATSGGVQYYCLVAHTNQAPPNASYWYAMDAGYLEIPTLYAITSDYVLKYAQSGDTLILTSPLVAPHRLLRFGATDWVIEKMTWSPSIAAPTGVTVSGTGGSNTYWAVTAIEKDTLVESVISSSVGGDSDASSGSPRTISWTAQPAAQEFAVFKQINGIWGFIGSASGTSFVDNGITPDTSLQPPTIRDLADIIGKPSVVAFHQQRLVFGGGDDFPEKLAMSRIGDYNNFGIHSPLQDDDSIAITIAGKKVSEIRSMIPMGQALVVLTASAEYTIQGDAQGLLTYATISVAPQAYSGSGWLDALPVGETALFVQARGTIVRDLQYEFATDGYRGRDLTVYSQHLFDGHTITDWAYAQTPNSIVWGVRDDGIAVGLTYVREHDVWGWHWHTTAGYFEQVLTVPEGGRDAVYFIVRRTIAGNEVRYLERMASRQVDDLATDARFTDAHVYADSSADVSGTMTLSTAGTWAYTEDITLTSSDSLFVVGDVGDEVWLNVVTTSTPSDGGMPVTTTETLRCRIITYVGSGSVKVIPNKDVPTAFQSVAFTNWEWARRSFTGFGHLEGETLSVLADGFVHPQVTVSSGAITLDRPCAKVCAGLPYDSDMQTLAIETLQAETFLDKRKRVNQVTVLVQESRGFHAGADFTAAKLREAKVRTDEGYDDPVRPITGSVDIRINSGWDDSGSIALRNSDPLPLTVLAVVPRAAVVGD